VAPKRRPLHETSASRFAVPQTRFAQPLSPGSGAYLEYSRRYPI